MNTIFELYASAYLPAAGIRRRQRPDERQEALETDGEPSALCVTPEEPQRGAVYSFTSRLVRETAAAFAWQRRQNAKL